MYLFTYHDNHHPDWKDSAHPGRVLFTVVVEDIVAADKQFQAATGIDPERAMQIGREIERALDPNATA